MPDLLAPLYRDWAMSPRDVAPRYRGFWNNLWGYVPLAGVMPRNASIVRTTAVSVKEENATTAISVITQRGLAVQLNGNDGDQVVWQTGIPTGSIPGAVVSVLMTANIRRTSPVHLSDIHLAAFNVTTNCYTMDTRSVTPNGVYARLYTNSTTVPENIYTGCGTTGCHAFGFTATGAQAGDTFVGFSDGVKGTPLSLAGSRSGGNTGASELVLGTTATGRNADGEYNMVSIWSAALADALMVKLTGDPFGPFRRTRRVFQVPDLNLAALYDPSVRNSYYNTLIRM